jgi:thioredoxin 1
MTDAYQRAQPELSAIEAETGVLALDFGTDWCGFCRAAAPHIQRALAAYPAVRHIKVEDASGRPLGRAFRVKLWPTVVVLRDGKEVGRVVRPAEAGELERLLASAHGNVAR